MIKLLLILSWFLLCSIFPIPFSHFQGATVAAPPPLSMSYTFSIANPTSVAGDLFAFGVAISNDGQYAVVGAEHDTTTSVDAGQAYIFTKSGSTWSLQQTIPPPSGIAYDNWGTASSIVNDGTRVIITGFAKDGGATDAGAAGVYTRSGSTWTLEQYINNPEPTGTDYMGHYVSMSDDGFYFIISAVNDDSGASNAGSAYIFFRTGATWALQQALRNPTPATGDSFSAGGVSISNDGTYAVVATPADDTGATNAGSVYIYVRSGTTWSLQQTINNPNPAADDTFGQGTAMSGNGLYIVVGAYQDDASASNAGTVYIYSRTDTTWSLQQTINNPQPIVGGGFGIRNSISDNGDYLLTATYIDDTIATDAGVAFTYTRSGTTWTKQQTITKPSAAAGDQFGVGISLSGDGLYSIIGAWDLSDAGSAYIYKR